MKSTKQFFATSIYHTDLYAQNSAKKINKQLGIKLDLPGEDINENDEYIQLISPKDSLALCEISFYEQNKEDKPIQGVKVSADITPLGDGEELNMVRYTVQRRRTSSIAEMRKRMEVRNDDEQSD